MRHQARVRSGLFHALSDAPFPSIGSASTIHLPLDLVRGVTCVVNRFRRRPLVFFRVLNRQRIRRTPRGQRIHVAVLHDAGNKVLVILMKQVRETESADVNRRISEEGAGDGRRRQDVCCGTFGCH